MVALTPALLPACCMRRSRATSVPALLSHPNVALVLCQTRSTLSMMSSSESPEGLHPAEDPPYFRKRKTSKIILDALGVSCQVAPSTTGEVGQALMDPLAAEVDPAAAADVRGIPCHSTA